MTSYGTVLLYQHWVWAQVPQPSGPEVKVLPNDVCWWHREAGASRAFSTGSREKRSVRRAIQLGQLCCRKHHRRTRHSEGIIWFQCWLYIFFKGFSLIEKAGQDYCSFYHPFHMALQLSGFQSLVLSTSKVSTSAFSYSPCSFLFSSSCPSVLTSFHPHQSLWALFALPF